MIFKIFHTTNFPFAFLIYDVISASIGNFEYFLIRFTASIKHRNFTFEYALVPKTSFNFN